MNQPHTRELTTKERRAIRRLVTSACANHDSEYGCLALECACYMFTIAFHTSVLCRYFRAAVLPLDPELAAVFTGQPVKPCQRCGRSFPVEGRRAYCSEACAAAALKAGTAARVRRHREQVTGRM